MSWLPAVAPRRAVSCRNDVAQSFLGRSDVGCKRQQRTRNNDDGEKERERIPAKITREVPSSSSPLFLVIPTLLPPLEVEKEGSPSLPATVVGGGVGVVPRQRRSVGRKYPGAMQAATPPAWSAAAVSSSPRRLAQEGRKEALIAQEVFLGRRGEERRLATVLSDGAYFGGSPHH